MRNFDHTVNVLVKAYLNDELKHGMCEMCAVGNIVHAAGFGRFHTKEWEPMNQYSCGNWKAVFVTMGGVQRKFHAVDKDWEKIGLKMIMETGYSVDELANIEYAFETAYQGATENEWMFNGLMDVVDVLAEIHGVDLEVKESAKLLFIK